MTTMQALEDERRSEAVARRIRGLMAELQIRQKAIAEELGYSQQALSRRTTGAVAFSIDEIETLSRMFGVTEAYLYGFQNDRTAAPQEEGRRSLYGIRDSNPEPAVSVLAHLIRLVVAWFLTVLTETPPRSASAAPSTAPELRIIGGGPDDAPPLEEQPDEQQLATVVPLFPGRREASA